VKIPVHPALPTKPPPFDETNVLVAIVVLVLGAVVLGAIVIAIVRWRRNKQLSRPAKLVDHELVTLTGIVRATAPLVTAPLSGRNCVVHRSRARVFDPARHEPGRSVFGAVPAQLSSEPSRTESARFAIETPNGVIQVDTDVLELDLVPSPVVPRSEPRELAFLESLGIGPDRHASAGFDEIVIEPGKKISIRGMLRIDGDLANTDERGYRDGAPTRMRLVAADTAPVTIQQIW
jgi:hypothetical protein